MFKKRAHANACDDYEREAASSEFAGRTPHRRQTHAANPSDWRVPKDSEDPRALEYIGPTTGWYKAPPCDVESYEGVYLIQAQPSGKVKIGWSDDAFRRLTELQTSSHETLSVVGVLDLDRASEKHLHTRFRHLNVRGEWFEPEVLDALDDYQRAF